ncbi:MAG: muramidase, partial [Mesorhizobium sp.]
MRIPGAISFLIASLCLAGCTSTAGVDALDLQKPSNETTSSVIRPPAPIAAAPAARGNRAARAELAPMSGNGPEEKTRPFGLAEEEETGVFAAPDVS